jgi:hypothetical protein
MGKTAHKAPDHLGTAEDGMMKYATVAKAGRPEKPQHLP